jgi:multicomponent Na+:H+ antiporter subunit G
MITFVAYVLLGVGAVFSALGTIALHRFPDVYTRMHGATKCTTFGSLFIYLGVMVYGASILMSGDAQGMVLALHTFVVLVMILLTNPTGAHAIARAAHRSGVKPVGAITDALKGEKA